MGQHSLPGRFHPPDSLGHALTHLLQRFQDLVRCLVGALAGIYTEDCHIQGVARPILLKFTMGFKKSAAKVLPTVSKKHSLSPGFQKIQASRSTDHLQILGHFSITTLQVWHEAQLHTAGIMGKPQTVKLLNKALTPLKTKDLVL